MAKEKSELVLAREGKVGKLSIVGDIGWDWFGVDYPMFKSQLSDLGDVDILEVEINSPGGIVTDGVAMFNALREHPAPVHIYVVGMAGSIASVIAMAADRLFIPDNALVFIHKPLNGLMGNADDMRKMADDLDKFESALTNSYMRLFKGSEDEIEAMMSGDTWLTAEEMDDKFNSVTVISSKGGDAVAKCDIVAELGDIVAIPKESAVDRAVNAVRHRVINQVDDPKEVDMTPEQIQAMVDAVADATASAVVVALDKKDTPPAKEPEAKIDVPFVGDMQNLEDVEAHAKKVEVAEIQAAADMTTVAGVQAYHAALAKSQGVVAPVAQSPASSQSVAHVAPKTDVPFSSAELDAAKARMSN